MAEARKAKIQDRNSIQSKVHKKQPEENRGKRLAKPVRKRKAPSNKIDPKNESTIKDKLGKTIFERLGKKLPLGAVIIGKNHVLGPKLAQGTIVVGNHILGPKVKPMIKKPTRKQKKNKPQVNDVKME